MTSWPRERNDALFIFLLAAVLAALATLHGLDRDQMIPYLTGLRAWAGQVAYQDYYIPQGPISGWLFGLFLKLTPTGGLAVVISSALLNAAESILIWHLLLQQLPQSRSAVWGGLLTAVWFLPIFGSFYHDHLAYFFITLAYYGWTLTTPTGWILGGVSLALAYHTKQTVGLIGLLTFSFIFFKKGNRKFCFALGWLITQALILVIIHDRKTYFLSTYIYPFHYSVVPHSDKNPVRLILGVLFPYQINPWQMLQDWGLGRILMYPVVIAAYVGLYSLKKSKHRELLFYFLFSSLWCAALLGRLHAHLFLGMGIVIAVILKPRQELWIVAGVILCGLGYLWHLHGRPQTVDVYYSGTDLYPLHVPLSNNSIANHKLIDWLQQEGCRTYAVLGDSTALASLALRQAPVNKPVIFTNITVPVVKQLRQTWSEDFIQSLESKKVGCVISGFNDKFATLPRLSSYLQSTIWCSQTTENFVMYRRK